MTKHDFKELAAMGAELGAAKAENDRLRGLLEAALYYVPSNKAELRSLIDSALSRQAEPVCQTMQRPKAECGCPDCGSSLIDWPTAEPTDAFTAVDMATAAAQGFRDGQAALVEAAQGALSEIQATLEDAYLNAYQECCGQAYLECCGSPLQAWSEADQKIMDRFAPHEKSLRHALAAPIAQTAPQGKFRMGDLVKKSTGSEWQGRICGTYSTALTPEGYAVESEAHAGSVQIYPAKALEAVE